MMTMAELAKEQNVSYEAIRKSVARYKKELEGHITIRNRKWYIDDEGADFLRTKRQSSPVVIYNQKEEEELRAAKEEAEQLRKAFLDAQNRIIELQGKLIAVNERETQFLEDRAKYTAFLEAHEQTTEELKNTREQLRTTEDILNSTRERLQHTEEELQDTKGRLQEAGTYKKSLFGFYRKL